MGLVKIKHSEVLALGEVLEEHLPFWEARGWSLHDETAALPAETARKSVWVDYATGPGGISEDEAEGLTKAQLIERFSEMPELTVVDPTTVADTTTTTTTTDDEENVR